MSSEKALRTRAAIIAAARGIILKEGIGALTMTARPRPQA